MAPDYNLASIAVHDDKIAWGNSQTVFLSTVDTFPSYKRYVLDYNNPVYRCSEMQWSGNGQVLYALKKGRLSRFRYSDEELIKDASFNGDISAFHLLPNMDGTKVVVAFDGGGTATRRPGWRAGAELEFSGNSYKTTSVFTDQTEDSMLGTMFMNKQGDIYFAVYTEPGNRYYHDYKIKSGEDINDLYKCGPMAMVDVSPSGGRLLFSGQTEILKDKSGDPLTTLFLADVKGDAVGTPRPILIPHSDPIFREAQFADENTILWTDLVRGDDGNEIIKRTVSESRFVEGSWEKPALLFDIPNEQVLVIASNERVIALVNSQNQVVVFDRSATKSTPKVLDMELATLRGDASKGILHEIQVGETLSSISRSHGVSVGSLIDLNHLIRPDEIFAHDSLILPESADTNSCANCTSSNR
ncbi:MAG: LysM domain-containing protein [Spirochaetales bacterium]|nr:LysM domain-containing protein [Spirochaetales bacterium]